MAPRGSRRAAVVTPDVYNPLAKRHLGESVAGALLTSPLKPLPPSESFTGAGVYAIYYLGARKLYGCLPPAVGRSWNQRPIYVGKAIPKGGRKGGGRDEVERPVTGTVLHDRLREHAESIQQARNLNLKDFGCRYLVVDDIWIPLGETLVIEKFAPVWNVKVDGFGNHDPGKGRYMGAKPSWDVLHPGRAWAARCRPNPKSAAQLKRGVREFLK